MSQCRPRLELSEVPRGIWCSDLQLGTYFGQSRSLKDPDGVMINQKAHKPGVLWKLHESKGQHSAGFEIQSFFEAVIVFAQFGSRTNEWFKELQVATGLQKNNPRVALSLDKTLALSQRISSAGAQHEFTLPYSLNQAPQSLPRKGEEVFRFVNTCIAALALCR